MSLSEPVSPVPFPALAAKSHFLTVVIEDYFHGSALNSLIPASRWSRFETRIERNVERALDLLDRYSIRATFFALGWVADNMPHVVQEVAGRGHEVASKGYYRRSLEQMSRDEFRQDVRRSVDAIEQAIGKRVLGYRVAKGSLGLDSLWALDVLADEGLQYDSSLYPRYRSIAREPWRRFPHAHQVGERTITELPLSTFGTDRFLLRVAGGNYIRQVPAALHQRMFRHWHEHYKSPFNMYFHVWELDPDMPRISGASTLSRIRHYRNILKMPELLKHYFENYSFVGIADGLGLERQAVSRAVDNPATYRRSFPEGQAERDHHSAQGRTSTPVAGAAMHHSADRHGRLPVTVVVPCYNEQAILPYLARTLDELRSDLGPSYDLSFLFVDDGSSDSTWIDLERLFGTLPDCRLLRHQENRGVAEAILTGLRAASTEIVCSIDADCTYDPHQLKDLIPMLSTGTDLVTASPYHPQGRVLNVPRWRLFLSRTASQFYRRVLQNKLFTYTSCFRVYRRSAVEAIELRERGFLGVTELLCRLDRAGATIVECPAVLEVRLLGISKLRTAAAVAGHLKLLYSLWRTTPKRGSHVDHLEQMESAGAEQEMRIVESGFELQGWVTGEPATTFSPNIPSHGTDPHNVH